MKTKPLILALFVLALAVIAIGADPRAVPLPGMFRAPASAAGGSLPDALLEIAALRAEVLRQHQIIIDLTDDVADLRDQAKADGRTLPKYQVKLYPSKKLPPFRTQSGLLEMPLVPGMTGQLPCPVTIKTISGKTSLSCTPDPSAPLPDMRLGITGLNTSGFGMTPGNRVVFSGQFRVTGGGPYHMADSFRLTFLNYGLEAEGDVSVTLAK